MTVSVLHQKVSAIADDPASVAAGEVVPSDWNASHNITMDSGFLLGRSTAGAGSAEEITVGSGLSLSGGTLSASGTTGVSSFSAGTTGFTPNTATTGDVTLAGTLAVANGGTGVTTSTGTGSVVLSTGPTFAPDVVMSGSSSNPILRITQTGTGHALLIEDEASTDATPVVVNNAGSVILGSTTQPAVGTVGSHKITVSGATAADASFLCYRSDVSAGPATFTFGKTRGTDPLNSGDVVGRLEAAGRDATSAGGGDERTPIARIEFAADGAPALDNMPGRITFQTTPSGSNTPVERMRIDNAGNVGIGGTPTVDSLRLTGTASGGTTINGLVIDETVGSGVTTAYRSVLSRPILENATFTLTNLHHFYANPQTKPAAATLTNQYGFNAESTLTDATNNYGIYSNIAASGTARWNIYANGTAPNYMAGPLGIGATTTVDPLRIGGTLTGSAYITSIAINPTVGSAVTGEWLGVLSRPTTQAATFTLDTLIHFMASPGTKGAGSTITNQYGFLANSMTGATNNYGVFVDFAASGTSRWSIYVNGTAPSYFASVVRIGATTGDQALNVNGAVRVSAITSANQTSAGTMDFTGGALRFLSWGASGTQGTIQWWTGSGALGATQRMTLTGSNNLGLATATFGTNATNTFSIASGTAPSSGVADTVQLYSSDLSAGNTIPSWYTEGTNVGTGTPTADRTIAVRYNGTVYYLLASTIP